MCGYLRLWFEIWASFNCRWDRMVLHVLTFSFLLILGGLQGAVVWFPTLRNNFSNKCCIILRKTFFLVFTEILRNASNIPAFSWEVAKFLRSGGCIRRVRQDKVSLFRSSSSVTKAFGWRIFSSFRKNAWKGFMKTF